MLTAPGRPLGFWLFGCWLSCGATVVCADVVVPAGHPAVVSATVTRLENGQLFWRALNGNEVSRPIDEVAYLQITGWPAFNTAERQLRENHPRQAVASYEKALRALIGEGPRNSRNAEAQLDRLTLLRCRLLRAAEADGQHASAVALYVQLLEGDGGTALQPLRPRRIPDPGSTQFAPAFQVLSAAIERHGDDEVGRILQQWRRIWPEAGAVASSPAAAVGENPVPPPEETITRIQALHRAGQFDETLALLRDLRIRVSGLKRADAYYWEAQTHLARAAANSSDPATDRRRAGLAFMRVAVHFPDSPRAPEALYAAGQICHEDGLDAQARALWMETITRYPAGGAFVERARQELNRVTAGTQPAR